MQKPVKYYQADDYNHYCFFKPLSTIKSTIEHQVDFDQEYELPNPLDRYQAPTPRLVPIGYY